jgi:ABC-2 type transport system ATP-binding protein
MIINYLGADNGEIFIGGKSISENSAELRKYIGYLPEHNPLYLDMNVVDYLKYYGALQDIKKVDLNDRVREMIVRCGLDKEKYKKISELSKGYRQRVGLAQAIIHKPEILILDEPTTGLDPNQIVEIRNLIRELGKDRTVLFSTHILSEVEATCDRILIINNGKIVANGTAESLRTKASGSKVYKTKILDGENESVFNSIHALDSVSDLKLENGYYIVQSKSDNENATNRDIFNMCVKNNWVLSEMIPVETKFEDVFRTLTNN